MHDTERLCTLWLTTVFGYGSKKPAELIERFGSAYNVFENGRDELYFGSMAEEIRSAFENKDLSYPEFIVDRCMREGVRTVCIQEKEYPKLLRQIPNPPAVLYYRGNLSRASEMTFTVVGTRRADEEGRKIALDFVPPLQQAGFTIVSGFAEGIESYIHKNTKPTVAVLPNGINICYPSCNKGVQERLVENDGLVLTEFMFDIRPFKGNFYLRNRLLAGLSYGVLIIEATDKSGTSITASAAGDYGRDVYVVPGSVYNPRFNGVMEMLRNGAIPVSKPEHIITDFAKYEQIRQPLCTESNAVAGAADLSNPKYADLEEDERTVLACINGNRVHPDEITARTGLDISAVNAALVSLELSDLVTKLDGNQYIIQ